MKFADHRSPKQDPEWKLGFLFLGNQLALDFLNTWLVPASEPVELLPDFKALLEWFQAAKLLTPAQAAELQSKWGGTSRAEKTVTVIRELRETLRQEVLRWERGKVLRRAAMQELNGLMALHPMRRKLEGGSKGLTEKAWFEAREPEDLLAPLADGTARLFAESNRSRVRKCGRCVAHFQDTSKKGTRRWCSMQLCGNRLKVAAYAARKRSRLIHSRFRTYRS